MYTFPHTSLSTKSEQRRKIASLADEDDGLVWVAVPTGYRNPLYLGCASRLRGRIDASGLQRQQVAAMSGLSHGSVCGVEDGKQVPRLATIEKLGDALGISPIWLAYGDEGLVRFRHRRPRPAVPFDPPEPHPAARPVRERWRGVSRRLGMARRGLGFTLRDIGEAAGISGQGVLRIERGDTEPMIHTVEQLAVALDVAPGWLAFGEGEGPEYIGPIPGQRSKQEPPQ